MEKVEAVARAICQERCAFYGDPACHRMDEWQDGMDCDGDGGGHDVGCRALAVAALAAVAFFDARGGSLPDAPETAP